MLIGFLIFASAIAVIFLLIGIAIGNTGREQLRSEIASLKERLAAADSRYVESRRITGELLSVVKDKVGLKEPQPPSFNVWKDGKQIIKDGAWTHESVARSMSDYVPPEAKNCPECSVSVRSDTWPQECPACHCMFGFVE